MFDFGDVLGVSEEGEALSDDGLIEDSALGGFNGDDDFLFDFLWGHLVFSLFFFFRVLNLLHLV